MGEAKLYCGIDPGVSGAIAIIDSDFNVVEICSAPTETRGKKQQLCESEFARLLRPYAERIDLVVIERVNAMPGQGVTSSFNFGMSYGIARGVVAGLGIRKRLVSPVTWKKYWKLQGLAKDQARTLARELWSNDLVLTALRYKKDCDKADALLIAAYGLYNPA